jgi:hypothetical protein
LGEKVIKLVQICDNAVYFTYEYSVSARIDNVGRIVEMCECGDAIFRHRTCKHVRELRKSDEYKALMAKQVRK